MRQYVLGGLVVVLFVSCIEPETRGEVCQLLPGDLVVTEFLTNPVIDGTSSDADQEWFEIYNATRDAVTLDRLILQRYSLDDAGAPTLENQHVVRAAGELGPLEYFVFGNGPAGGPAQIDYSYDADDNALGFGETFGQFTNGQGGLGIACRDTVIDTVLYGAPVGVGLLPEDGRSLSLDGSFAPDGIVNDNNVRWCPGGERFDGVNFGTPGQANPPCTLVRCEEGGVTRDAIVPGEADLLITEAFVDPTGADGDRYWLELLVLGSQAMDLNELRIVVAGPTVEEFELRDVSCATVSPGDYVVIGNTLDTTENGGAAVDFAVEDLAFGRTAFAAGASIEVWHGATLVDRAMLPPVADTDSGFSWMFDGALVGQPDPGVLNDVGSAFCRADPTLSDDFDGFGTPGAANPECDADLCRDSGTVRDIVLPGPGDLVVSEVLLDAAGADGDKYWIELFVAASAPVELNRLVIQSQAPAQMPRAADIPEVNCLAVTPGEYVVVGVSMDPIDNGGITPDAISPGLRFGQSFFDAGGTVQLLSGSTVVDSAAFPPVESAQAGRSWMLDGGAFGLSALDARNDITAAYCPAPDSATGNFDELGTPGLPNLPCGTIACNDGGTLRAVSGPAPGDIAISEVFANPTSTDRNLEWLEVYPPTQTVDLNGLTVANRTDSGSENAVVVFDTDCITVSAGDHYLLGIIHRDDVGTAPPRGGITPDFDLEVDTDSFLFSSELTVELFHSDLLVDTARVPAAVEGVSQSLANIFLRASDNDVIQAYCESVSTGVFDEIGTPGSENDICGAIECRDGPPVIRAVVPPSPGDLVISEVFADPSGSDRSKEWLELLVVNDTDLNGLTVRNSTMSSSNSAVLTSEDCLRGTASSLYLIGILHQDDLPSVDRGGITPDADLEVSSSSFLFGSEITLELEHSAVVLDVAQVPAASSGIAQSVDPTLLNVTDNDPVTAFCPSEVSGAFDEEGTPGLANVCGPACWDAGVPRNVDPPGVGELVISEVHADPGSTAAHPSTADDRRDWVEVYATRDLDLNTLIINSGASRDWSIDLMNCLVMSSGTYGVIAGSNASIDGVAPIAELIGEADTLFLSTPATLSLQVGATIIDATPNVVTSELDAQQGQSTVLMGSPPDAVLNDGCAQWCLAEVAENGFAELGSPGIANTNTCVTPLPAVCN